MNDKIFQLVSKILDSRLSPQTQEEIIRFYILPRNTPVPAMIEMADEELGEAGVVSRPNKHDLDRKNNPELAAEEEAVKNTLKGRVEGT